MCGLVGMAGNLEIKDEDVMKRLLILDSWRGMHSTGMAAIRDNGNVVLSKISSHPFDLFEMPKFKSALHGPSSCVFLGHNRAATRGEVSTFNAHPFEFGHIIGAHNGTLWASSHDKLDEALGEKFPVDSMSIFAGFERLGVEETMKMLRGAWSLVWVDKKEGTLNFLRNKERPMWFGYAEDKKVLGWASEWQMLNAAWTSSEKGRKFHYDKKGNAFWATPEDYLWSWKIADLAKGGDVKPKVREMKGDTSPAVYTPTPPVIWNRRQQATDPLQTKNSSAISTIHSRSTSDEDKEQFTTNWTPKEEFDGKLTRDEFEGIAAAGCSFCGDDVKWGMSGVSIWPKSGIVLGPCCSHQGRNKAQSLNRVYLPLNVA